LLTDGKMVEGAAKPKETYYLSITILSQAIEAKPEAIKESWGIDSATWTPVSSETPDEGGGAR